MALRSEIAETLSGFENRMKVINIMRCILDYRYPDHIRKMMPNKQILDNVIVAALVFIKDRTLGTDQTCTLAHVEQFLEDFSEVFPNGDAIDAKVLARYIMVDVLQNGGVITEYDTFYSSSETFEPMVIRLINEEKGSYYLTDDAFDFLFRSKEIETELDYSITRFRMKEYMRRSNYEKALDASRELVSRIRNMKVSMDTFLLHCREDLSKVTVDYYETVIARFRDLLEDEYKELIEIQATAEERAKIIEEAAESGLGSEETKRHRVALRDIIDNISLTIDEQRVLINKKTSLSEAYQTLIRDNFVVSSYTRMNFERDVLIPLRKMEDKLGDVAKFLLFPLIKPEFEKMFSVENFYAPQGKMVENEKEEGVDITAENSELVRLIEQRGLRFRDIICDLFRFMDGKDHFTAGEFVDSLRVATLKEYCEDHALPIVFLSLFAEQEIDIAAWRTTAQAAPMPSGEFELEWCLESVPEEHLCVKKLRISETPATIHFSVQQDGYERAIDMTDFRVEVSR